MSLVEPQLLFNYTQLFTDRKPNQFTIAHQNVQGIFSKLNIVEIFVDMISPSIFCISEHFLNSTEMSVFCFPGYTTAASYCRSAMDGGGVCILVKEGISFQSIDVDRFCIEGYSEFTSISFMSEDIKYFLITVYRPPHKSVACIDNFLHSLHDCIESFDRPNVRIIIAGDFNIDLSVVDNSSRKFSEMMLSFGLRSTVFSFTREFLGSKTQIDNIFLQHQSFAL